jgi:hypothetical protein
MLVNFDQFSDDFLGMPTGATLWTFGCSQMKTPFYSLKGTPNVSRAVRGGRTCAPMILGDLPISCQI